MRLRMITNRRPSGRWWVPPLVSTGLCLAVFAVFWAMRYAKWLESFELKAYDACVMFRPKAPPPAEIVLFELDDKQLSEMGQTRLNDGQLAQALNYLVARGARVIGIDLFRDLDQPP